MKMYSYILKFYNKVFQKKLKIKKIKFKLILKMNFNNYNLNIKIYQKII